MTLISPASGIRAGIMLRGSDAETLAEADIVIITTDHSVYDYAMIVEHSQLILDTRNACAGIKSDKISKL